MWCLKKLNDELWGAIYLGYWTFQKSNTTEVGDEVISSGQVGYMVLFRYFHKIEKCGSDLKPLFEKISDPEIVRKIDNCR